MVSNVNNNANLMALYKLAMETKTSANRTISKPVDAGMTRNGSIFNSKSIAKADSSARKIENQLNSIKTLNLSGTEKSQISKVESQLNEIKSIVNAGKTPVAVPAQNSQTVSQTQSNSAQTGAGSTKLSSIKTSTNKTIKTLNSTKTSNSSATLYQRCKTTSNINQIMKTAGRRMQSNPITSAQGQAVKSRSVEDVIAQIQQKKENVQYYFDCYTGKKYRVSAFSCISSGQAFIDRLSNHTLDVSKLNRMMKAR